MPILIIILLILNLSEVAYSQVLLTGAEASNWHFGENSSIKFDLNNNKITTAYSPIITEEGSACISDNLGNLLFFCSGETVWNRNHQVMKGGWGLLGGYSSTQASLILQQPGSNNIFYIFNTGDHGTNLYYSIVDMSLDNGLGEVVSLNNLLFKDVGEKLTACYAQNGYDIWLIVKEKHTHSFLSFLIDDSGIDVNPVRSVINLDYNLNNKICAIGYLKFSPDGRKLSSSSYCNSQFELYDFDKLTGLVINPDVYYVDKGFNTYGISFSPDSRFLYVSCFDYDTYIYQFDVTQPTHELIEKTKTTVAEFHDGLGLGAIQEGPDGKLYVSRYKNKYLSSIDNPNSKGTQCQFTENSIFLNGNRTRLGLPNFAYVNYYSSPIPNLKNYNVQLLADGFKKYPGDTCSIRIYAKQLHDTTLIENASLSFTISFDAQAFSPELSDKYENQLDGRLRKLRFQFQNLKIDTNALLLREIKGLALFGDKTRYEISFQDVNWSDTSITTYKKSGIMEINDVCRSNLRKIASISNKMSIYPIPADDGVNIDFIPDRIGFYKIKVLSCDGSECYSENIQIENIESGFKYYLSNSFGSGCYFVVLSVDNEVTDSKTIMFIK
jgi:hypothetical protein